MRTSTHRLALRAAARLALPFGLAGCGAALTTERATIPDAAAPDAAVSDAAAEASVSPSPVARCELADPTRSPEAEAACCRPLVDAALRADAGVGAPRVMGCCAALAQWFDRPENRGDDWSSSEARAMCCEALGWRGSNTCTPWGPPVPPAADPNVAPRTDGAWLDLRGVARAEMPSLPELPGLFAAAVPTWLGRMVNEHESSAVFESLAAQLASAGLDEARVRACRGFADEERRHGVLCGAVVEALGGEARAPSRAHPPFPAHPGVEPREAVLRNVLSVCCLSETVAVALIGAERLEMPAGPLRELLTRILADEVGHARFGWTLLRELAPSLTADARARLGAYLSVAFAHLERHELEHLPLHATPPEAGAALGLCNGRDARALFFDTVREVIVPALESLGLPAAEAWSGRGDAAGALAA